MNRGGGSLAIGGTVSRKGFEARSERGTAAMSQLPPAVRSGHTGAQPPLPTGAPPEDSPLNKHFALELLVIQHELDRDQWSIAGNVVRAIGATVED